jgi:TRAP-type C4-dicarboxylate transport system permease small subunit
MDTSKLAGIVLLVVGCLGLAYGGFNYTKDTHRADIGSLHLAVNETQHVNVPVWAGVGAILLGGLLLGVRAKR